MDIAPEKVGYIIQMTRQMSSGSGFSDDDRPLAKSLEDLDYESLDESPENGPGDQVSEYIDGLNEDEALDLVALMWVGRGTYRPEQFERAREVAKPRWGKGASPRCWALRRWQGS